MRDIDGATQRLKGTVPDQTCLCYRCCTCLCYRCCALKQGT